MSSAFNAIMSIACIFGSAIAAGLTQGLLSINPLEMNIKMRSGTEQEKQAASRVLPIITHHHLLLVTLMLFNASANEALPLFLDELVPSWLAIVLSVTLVLLFGEIIPSAIFTGPKQIEIASTLSPFVWCLIAVLFPIAYPISKALDYWLGHDDGMTIFNRSELAAMMHIQQEEGNKRGEKDVVHGDEISIISGALNMRDVKVGSVMTEDIFMLSMNDRLTISTLSKIFNSGYSRIPIYDRDRNDVTGLMLVKDLLFIDPDDEISIRSFMTLFGRPIQYVWPDEKLKDVLITFKKTHNHMAVVRDVNNSGPGDPFYEVKGIITMEDIIESILGTDILDETDAEDENNRIKRLNRHIDFAQLRHLTSQLNQEERLSSEEVKVIVSHLYANVPQVKELVGENNTSAVEQLVRSSKVMNISGNSSDFESTTSDGSEAKDEYLYKVGKISNACTLILSGKVSVVTGKERFVVEMGPWSVLGANVLLDKDGVYVPDFTAKIISKDFRCIRILKPGPHPESSSIRRGKPRSPRIKNLTTDCNNKANDIANNRIKRSASDTNMHDVGDSSTKSNDGSVVNPLLKNEACISISQSVSNDAELSTSSLNINNNIGSSTINSGTSEVVIRPFRSVSDGDTNSGKYGTENTKTNNTGSNVKSSQHQSGSFTTHNESDPFAVTKPFQRVSGGTNNSSNSNGSGIGSGGHMHTSNPPTNPFQDFRSSVRSHSKSSSSSLPMSSVNNSIAYSSLDTNSSASKTSSHETSSNDLLDGDYV